MADAIDDLFRRFGKAFNKADVDAIADHALRLVDGAANADVALVRFPIGAAVRPPGLSDDLDVGPCAPTHTHQTDASALLRRLVTAASPQETRS